MRTLILVPTRNRPELAVAAVESALRDLPVDADIVISDNSTGAADRAELRHRCELPEWRRVRYLYPPEPLPMTAHWAWALDTALAATAATHVSFLTDRMVFKPGGLPRLIETAALHATDVISYNHDMVDDHRHPVVLSSAEWSGLLLRVPSATLIRMGSLAQAHPALPRMLNCLVPVRTLEIIRARFGSVFASISPDHCFAYRCLAVCQSILYLDEALLVHYALDRSNGASYSRGVPSADSADFARQLGASRMNERAPVPEFHTIMNAVMNEYCFVRDEVADGFPPVDMPNYLDSMESGIAEIEEVGLRDQMRALLASQDRQHRWRSPPFQLARRVRRRARVALAHPARFTHRVLERGAEGVAGPYRPNPSSLVRFLRRLGLLPGWPGTMTFHSTAEAIEFASHEGREPNPLATHLLYLVGEAEIRRARAARR
jgi:hypothetical protein